MQVEIVNTGSELMLGRVLNTHQQWLCRQLSEKGYVVTRQTCVSDSGPAIQQAIKEALGRADVIITTGGLGPTSDDITRDLVAQLLGKTLREDASVLERITSYFASRKRPMPASTRIQAMVPEGAIVLTNHYGTAPGLAFEVRPNPFREGGMATLLLMLPGPPRELRPMFMECVMPLLERVLPPPAMFVCRTLRSTGIGESLVEERIAGPLAPIMERGLTVGYCARPGQVDVRLSAAGPEAGRLVEEAGRVVRECLGVHIYGGEEDELESALVQALVVRKKTLAVAESCTGGLISHRITNVPGASAVLLAGYVTYSNGAKQQMLGVREATLGQHGAVSEAVAREMAEGARVRSGADYAIAVTGIAGPSGGSPTKPVGTVFIAVAGSEGTLAIQSLNGWDRLTFKEVTAHQAMDLLRRKLVSQHT